MKKLFAAVLALVLLSSVFVSCKSHEKCPAYSKVEKESSVKN